MHGNLKCLILYMLHIKVQMVFSSVNWLIITNILIEAAVTEYLSLCNITGIDIMMSKQGCLKLTPSELMEYVPGVCSKQLHPEKLKTLPLRVDSLTDGTTS